MKCVLADGRIDKSKFRVLGNWQPAFTMESILTELKNEMHSGANRNLPQPNEGALY